MKTCKTCGESKPFECFNRRSDRPGGYAPKCKPCKARAAATYREQNLALVRARSLKWHHDNRDASIANTVAWQRANAEAFRATAKAYRDSRLEEIHANWRAWRDANRDAVRRMKASRRATLKMAVPSWANQTAIRSVYSEALRLTIETGIEHHVDHIVPLQSPMVCGLHVEHNLRAIPWRENVSKGNRWHPEMLEAVGQ